MKLPSGVQITENLRAFNNWRDDFLIELSTLLLMIGFIMGTVDILTRGGIVTSTWFSLAWAIVQAIAIDGLFFAVWGKVARSKWVAGERLHYMATVFVGVILAIVAMLVNDILSYQQLANIADSLVAMRALHIDSSLFVNLRAILVVAVALLVQLFCRSHSPEKATVAMPVTSITIARSRSHSHNRSHSPKKATMIDSHSPEQKAISEHASIAHSLEEIADSPATTAMHSPVSLVEPSNVAMATLMHSPDNMAMVALSMATDSGNNGYVAMEDVTDTHQHMAIVATGSQGYRDSIKATWLRYLQEGRAINLTDIARDTGVGYSTVKKWASSIREEIQQGDV